MTMRSPSMAFSDTVRDLVRGGCAVGVVGIVVNVLHLGLPLFTIQVYDRVLSSGSLETLGALVMLVTIILGFQTLLDVMRQRIFVILGGRVLSRLGHPVFEAAVESSLSKGAGAASGAMRDVSELRGFVAGGMMVLPLDLAMTPLFLFVLFMLHPAYGLVGLLGVGLLTAAAIVTERIARGPTAEGAHASAQVQAEAAEAMRNCELVAAMGMLSDLSGRWRVRQTEAIRLAERGQRLAKALTTLTRTLRLALQIGVISTGAILVSADLASAGTIIAASVMTTRLLMPFEMLMEGWKQWLEAFGALGRLRDITQSGSTTRSTTPVEIACGAISADRLTHLSTEGGRPLLRNVSFEIESGTLLGVIGPSGAGKSTLSRMLVGLWKPTGGGIYLDGQSTYGHERNSFGRAVGYLPQEPGLFNATARDNIARFGNADMAQVVEAARAADVHDMIGRLPHGYATKLGPGGVELSGGQRQRLALARAMLGRPKLVVLDEPNAHLDAEGESALIRAIDILIQRGCTVVVVAQRMSILTRADNLLVLKEGAVAHFGSREAVMQEMGPPKVLRDGRVGTERRRALG